MISLKFVPKGPSKNIPALVQMMAWRRIGDKPFSEPNKVSLLGHICVTRPQWVKDAIWYQYSSMWKASCRQGFSTKFCFTTKFNSDHVSNLELNMWVHFILYMNAANVCGSERLYGVEAVLLQVLHAQGFWLYVHDNMLWWISPMPSYPSRSDGMWYLPLRVRIYRFSYHCITPIDGMNSL